MLRGKPTTQCRSRDEHGGAKAQRGTASLTSLVLESELALFPRRSLHNFQFAGRLKVEAHCLILGLLQFVQYEIIFLYDRF